LTVSSLHQRNPAAYKAFNEYILKYQKVYNTIEEYTEKYMVFEKNFNSINEIQSLHSKPDTASFEFGVSPFMDMTPEDFKRQYLNLNMSQLKKLRFLNEHNTLTAKGTDAPAAHDWREHGAVTDVKNQGSCGSCWAFSTTGNLEGVYYLKTKKQVRFSEQQLVDCDKVDQGCNGGLMEDAYKYLQSAGGAMAEDDYSYTGSDDDCKFDKTKVKAQITGYKFAKSQNETEIAQMLYENGPLAVAINATPLQFYFWGVFDPWWQWICDPASLNHGVLIVGYGNNGSKDYWIVKNSWGSWWGESGYFRIVKGTGACGINTYVVSADISPVA
jgi:cathepsin F